MSDTFIPTMTDIKAGMESPKVATLNSEFLISQDALYDYYSTNSGMIAKNPSIGGAGGGSGGGGGGGGDDPSGQIQGLTNRVKNLEDKANAAADEAANVESNLDNYQNADDILNSVVTLKKSVQKLNN